jgi:hypothetical protein
MVARHPQCHERELPSPSADGKGWGWGIGSENARTIDANIRS